MRKKFLNEWFTLDFEDIGNYTRAQCIDIEFQTDIGPIFLMQTRYGNTFWLTRGEIKDHEVASKRRKV